MKNSETTTKTKKNTLTNILVKAVAALFLISVAIRAFYVEPQMLLLHKITIEAPHWKKELSGIKIAVIGDLHPGAPYINEQKINQVVNLVNSQKPDLLLMLGDSTIKGVVGGKQMSPERVAALLSEIKAPVGRITVLGNHDWWFDGMRVWHAFEKSGFTVLENDAVKLKYNNTSFWVSGVGDLDTREVLVNKALKKVGNLNKKEPIIMLSHSPDVFVQIPQRVSLTLSGHVHGGQVRIPLVGALIIPSKYWNRFAKGHIVENGRHLFVTTGVGTSILPMRFLCPPEVVLVTVK